MYDRYDLFINAGSDEIRVFKVVDACRNPVDTTGFKARMQIRPTRQSSVVLDELTTENKRLVFTDKGLKLHLTNEQTDAYDFCSGVYDIEVVNKEGLVSRLVEGRVYIRHGVTR